MAHNGLDTELQFLPGAGPKRSALLKKELAVETVGQLLRLYPFRYIDRSSFTRICDIRPDMAFIQIKATVIRSEIIDNKRLTEKVRKKTTAATSNRYFNYLCCLGAIHKLPQGEGNLTGVNLTFLLNEQENGKTRPINTFTVYKYTPKQLEKMEARAQLLLENGITQGNISHDKLVASGCAEMAAEVYYANSDKAIVKKERDFKRLLELLSRLCNEKGHTTKRELCDLLDWRKDKLDRILGTFKKEWQQQYSYKAPNKEETEQYNLKSKAWIMTRR